MKKRIISLCLVLVVLISGTSVLVSASTEHDPLITLSYLTDIFLPRARESLKKISDLKVSLFSPAEVKRAPTTKVAQIPANETITLTSGQEITILSGYGRITDLSGGIINVTVGWPAGLGRANNYQRYIMDANSKATITFTQDSVVSVSASAKTNYVYCPFTDVYKTHWFYDSVVSAYEKGLISGMTPTTFQPTGTFTVAQAIRLSSAMYQLYHDGHITIQNSPTGHWYDNAVAFAYEKGIIEERYTKLTPAEYNAPISRSEFVHIFFATLPIENYPVINSVPDNAVPDVKIGDLYADEIYLFYRAGIITGYAGSAAFAPDRTITRAEVATLLIRMFEFDKRVKFTME